MQTYLNIREVESAIDRLAKLSPGLCTLIELPNKTAHGFTSHALRLSTAGGGSRDALMVTAGVHACEWGTSDAAVFFATDVLAAFAANAGLKYGQKVFAKEAIQTFLTARDLVVFPLVNPDGRAYSQAHDSLVLAGWRKNRSPLPGRGSSSVCGVDINRNFDIAWDYRRIFDPAANLHVSDDPAQDNYHGPSPFSEAESRNVRWLLDQHPRTRWLVDVHGPMRAIQFDWGIDQTQSVVPSQNFRNSDWDGRRGNWADAYGEYKPLGDQQFASAIAARMSDAVCAVRGNRWPAEPVFDSYAVSGALVDYAYSRQIHSIAIEHGGFKFHPAVPQMALITDEICAALLELCVAIA